MASDVGGERLQYWRLTAQYSPLKAEYNLLKAEHWLRQPATQLLTLQLQIQKQLRFEKTKFDKSCSYKLSQWKIIDLERVDTEDEV